MKAWKAASVAVAMAVGLVGIGGCASSEQASAPSVGTGPEAVASADANLDGTELLSPEEGVVYIDVRTPEEYAQGHLEGAMNIDFQNSAYFSSVIKTLGKDTTYKIYCRSGNRSAQAAEWMTAQGLTVVDLGGMDDAQEETGFEVVR